jgi:hypothetical protein
MAMIHLVDLAPPSIRSKLGQAGFSNINSGPVTLSFAIDNVESHENRRCVGTETPPGQLATLIAVVEHAGAGLVLPRVLVPPPP